MSCEQTLQTLEWTKSILLYLASQNGITFLFKKKVVTYETEEM